MLETPELLTTLLGFHSSFQKPCRGPEEKQYSVGICDHIYGVCGHYLTGIKGKEKKLPFKTPTQKNKLRRTVKISNRKAPPPRSPGCIIDTCMFVTHQGESKSKETTKTKQGRHRTTTFLSLLAFTLHRIRWNTTSSCLSKLLQAEEWGTHAIHHWFQITNRSNVTSSL